MIQRLTQKIRAGKPDREIAAILAIFLLSRVVFFCLFDLAPMNQYMPEAMDQRALTVARGQSMFYFSAWGSFPLLLGAFYSLLESVGQTAHRLVWLFWVHQILAAATLVLTLTLARRWTRRLALPAVVPLAVGLILALDVYWLYFSAMAISETLFCLALAVVLLYLDDLENKTPPPLAWSLAAAMALGVAVISRNIILTFVPVVLFFVIRHAWQQHNPRRWLAAAGFCAVCWGVYQSAYRLAASHETHVAARAVSLNRAVNIAQTWCEAKAVRFNNQDGTFEFRPPAYWPMPVRSALQFTVGFENEKEYLHTAGACLLSRPWRVIEQASSLRNVFWGPLYPDPLGVEAKWWAIGWARLTALALLIGTAIAAVRLKSLALSPPGLAVAAMLVSVYLASPGEERFRASFMGPLVLCGVAGLSLMRTRRQWLICLGALVVVSVGAATFKPGWWSAEAASIRELREMPIEEFKALVEESWSRARAREADSQGAGELDGRSFCVFLRQTNWRGNKTVRANGALHFCQALWALSGKSWDAPEDPPQQPQVFDSLGPEASKRTMSQLAADLLSLIKIRRGDPSHPIYTERMERDLLIEILRYQLRSGKVSALHSTVFTNAKVQTIYTAALRAWLDER